MNNTSNTNYAAKITDTDAIDLAKLPEDSFYCEKSENYYTYEDIAISNNLVYSLEEVDEDMNENMFQIEWNGTTPVLKKRKLFPR